MSKFNFLPANVKLPEDFPTQRNEDGDRITPVLPESIEDLVPQLRVAEPPDVWMRQVGEGEDDWTRFLFYRDGPRPRRLIRPGAGHTADVYERANKWRWFERVQAYDNHLDRVRMKEVESFVAQSTREVTAEHMAILRDARELCAIELQRLLERAKKSSIDGTVKANEVFRLTELVIKYDRLLRDQATDNTQVVATTLEHMSVEELREAQVLAKKMQVGR